MSKSKQTLITSRDRKGVQFLNLCAVAYDKAKLNKEQAQQLNEKGGEFQEALGELIDSFSIYNQFPIQAATEILGSNKVIEFRDVVRAWGVPMPANNPTTIPYSYDTLHECADENKRSSADWRLVYVNGFSLRKQEEIRGRNRKNPPCFDPDYTWWLEKAQDPWGTQSIESGYQLLNFKKNLPSITWQSRENEIAKLGVMFERAEEQAVTEACLSIYMIKKERLLKDWYHQGRLQAFSDRHVCVGSFGERGFDVDVRWDGYSFSFVGVVLSRKS